VLFVSGFLDALGIACATIAGHSFGGLAALHFALARPERTARLVLVDSAGLGSAVHPGLLLNAARGYGELAASWAATPIGAAQRTLARARLLFADPRRVPRAWLAEQVRLALRPGVLGASLAALRSQAAWWGQREVLSDHLAELAMPVLVIWGAEDRVVPAAQAYDAVALLRRGRLALIPSCGHIPHVEQPDAFVEALGHSH
jgi:2-hydroxy-6-oxonona-2,4-dienedioate hydrolase